MKQVTRLAAVIAMFFAVLPAVAQQVITRWELSNPERAEATVTGDGATALTAGACQLGANIAKTEVMTVSNAEDGYTAVTYTPAFTTYYVTTRTTERTAGHCITFSVTPQSGHSFVPLALQFDAAKCGTDGGRIDAVIRTASGGETVVGRIIQPLRNRVQEGNSQAYSHHELSISDCVVKGESLEITFYIYYINGVDATTPKSIAFRNVTLVGVVDEPQRTVDQYLSSATFMTAQGDQCDLLSVLKGAKSNASLTWPDKVYGAPTDFQVEAASGYTASVEYADNMATISIMQNGYQISKATVRFSVSDRAPRPTPVALNRGLLAVNLAANGGSGNLVSWRYRESDKNNVKFKLWRGNSATSQTNRINLGNYIYSRTNFLDGAGTVNSYYRLEVYDLNDNLLESMVAKAWANQSMEIPTNTPTDERGLGAVYTPNDACFCDMDGDGEYEIILKWEPSNAQDAASNGLTSSNYIDCYKLNGKQLWRINIGPNLRSGAHTSPFLCYDFDGDGFGELICKTAPGTVDGEGNYVVMKGDDPLQDCLSGRGKPDRGPEYVTVFDGLTGAELSTMSYHTKYGDVTTSFWGDTNQNRSERYLACVAFTDGVTPSAIMCRGYYSGASLGAYDWDGMQLTLRWIHRSNTAGKELWGEGAHFVVSADVDNDGCDEIVYGAATLDHDGKKVLYRTGLGHGDALHVSDFDWDNDGLEIFMPHEGSGGYDLHDARTGKLLVRQNASGDTGRGLAANFDATHDGAELIASCTGAMMDCKNNVIASSWALGSSGAGINARIYWDGDPYDEFFDKSIIGHWNGASFDRVRVNGGQYFPGSLCNGSKNNPCVQGDMLGDWREEMVTWNASNNALIVTSTSYETEYRIPHLMDNRQYSEAIANQNCAYNQPPHLSYDPARKYSVTVKIPQSGYAPVYVPHTMQMPKTGKVYRCSGLDATKDTLQLKEISALIPGGTAVLVKGTPGEEVVMRPAIAKPTGSIVNKMLGDAYMDLEVESTDEVGYYIWEDRGADGLGFYRINGKGIIPAGTLYMKQTGATYRDAYSYTIGGTVPTAIQGVKTTQQTESVAYDLSGRRVAKQRGLQIINGKKVIVK